MSAESSYFNQTNMALKMAYCSLQIFCCEELIKLQPSKLYLYFNTLLKCKYSNTISTELWMQMSWNDVLQKLICVACCSDTAVITQLLFAQHAPYFSLLIFLALSEFNESFTAIDETQQGIWVLLNKIQSPLDCVAVLIRYAKLLRHFLLC